MSKEVLKWIVTVTLYAWPFLMVAMGCCLSIVALSLVPQLKGKLTTFLRKVSRVIAFYAAVIWIPIGIFHSYLLWRFPQLPDSKVMELLLGMTGLMVPTCICLFLATKDVVEDKVKVK